jgi:hypothetical protein
MHVILDFGHMMYGLIHIGVLGTSNRKLFGAVRNCMVDVQHSMHEFTRKDSEHAMSVSIYFSFQ